MHASALVTGAASGLGAATADRLAAEGFGVIRFDLHHQVGVVQGDVTDPDAVAHAVDSACQLAPLRVCIACAGVAPAARILGREGPHPLELFARTVAVNLVGSFNVLRLAAAGMARNEPDAEQQRGLVVLTASIAAFDGQTGQAAYAASKGGVAAMTLPAARDLARHGIRVVTIAPGVFDTPLVAGLPEKARQSLAASIPNPPRLGRPAEFAALVMHVLDNPMLNAATIRLDGGLRMGSS